MTKTTAPPDINHAAMELIAALDGLEAMAGFRHGFTQQIAMTRALIGTEYAREAAQILPIWEALDNLAAAVAERKEARHG